jgi:hypothetical protein
MENDNDKQLQMETCWLKEMFNIKLCGTVF